MMRKVCIVALLSFFLFPLGCGRHEAYVKRALLMGTFIEVQIMPDRNLGEAQLESIIKSAFGEIRRVEGMFSLYQPGSELKVVNESSVGKPYRVSSQFLYLLKEAISYSDLTKGAFSVSASNSGNITVDESNSTVMLTEGTKLDFGGIAKGYAVDRVIYFLEKAGVENAIVNAGGDMKCIGDGPDGVGWKVGIRDPGKKDSFRAALFIKDKAIATSGDYERPFHLINPATGQPVTGTTLSVSILAGDCRKADALATAVFVLGRAEGMRLVNSLDDTEAVIIVKDVDGVKIETSDGLREIDIYDQR